MSISINNNETPSVARPSLRKRRISGVAAPEATVEQDGLEKIKLATTDESDMVTDSAGEDTSSDVDAGYVVGKRKGVEEGKKGESVVKGEEGDDKSGKGDGPLPAKYVYRASAPAHNRVKESPLSSAAIFKQSHAGLFNLCIVVLIAVNSRLTIENLMKYGLLIRSGFWFSSKSLKDWPLFVCWLTLPAFPIAAFLIEKLAWRKLISEPVVVSLHILITSLEILYPVLVILKCDLDILWGLTLMLSACTFWLKLVSYAHTNYDLRHLHSKDKGEKSSEHPNLDYSYGVSFRSLVYFIMAPTLCYQLSYPRSMCIRRGWLICQFIQLVIFTGFMGFIIEQYVNPIIKNSEHPLKGNFLNAIERVLRLSLPVLYVWLCMFYCFFHLWLNILGEVLRFGDREFYKDWWNAKTIEEYWKMWNMPVHKWMVRHMYFPCIRNGLPKGAASVVSFFVSAVFHELCVGVPCHIFTLWAFMGIMLQVPMSTLTRYLQDKFKSSMVGNMIFWFFFCIFGQPMCVLLYYHEMMNRNIITQ
ncbi:diacylglycerol O-acyltransferase 1A isoform X3 [Dendrobium catenatum]|uniref:diacylglycerol O-acyltransferase 1A isoform X3 n=1 Tax=Dendrobium catenatum TaxID=906689 RepID=UPI0009F432B3|nr:diacylglycerol O-acyltransferase 1A isoform X3 [Dendrobium catenatum]